MKKKSLSLAQLKTMSNERREQQLGELVATTRQPPNGEIKSVQKKLHAYEMQHGINSDELRRKVASGEVKETADVCSWLMLLDLQDRLVAPR